MSVFRVPCVAVGGGRLLRSLDDSAANLPHWQQHPCHPAEAADPCSQLSCISVCF